MTDYVNATGHTYTDIVVEATEDSLGYTRHLCIVCNYSYLSDFVTSGDDGYIEEPKPVHEHKYELHVQDFEADKYFVALRVCICGDSKAGELNILLTNAAGETVQLVPNEYGQADYADVYGEWLVTITDNDGAQLTMFDLSAGEAPEEPTEPEDPDDGDDEPENPDGGEGDDDEGQTETPGNHDEENPDDGQTETPENPDEPSDETEENGGSGTAAVLLIVFILLVAGGIGAVIFLKKRKNKNQN